MGSLKNEDILEKGDLVWCGFGPYVYCGEDKKGRPVLISVQMAYMMIGMDKICKQIARFFRWIGSKITRRK
jgi:hypothetical protein